MLNLVGINTYQRLFYFEFYFRVLKWFVKILNHVFAYKSNEWKLKTSSLVLRRIHHAQMYVNVAVFLWPCRWYNYWDDKSKRKYIYLLVGLLHCVVVVIVRALIERKVFVSNLLLDVPTLRCNYNLKLSHLHMLGLRIQFECQ